MLTKRFSLGHSPIFQLTGQIMLLPYTCCCGVIFSLFVAQVDGAFTLVYGTSCSSPVVGAIFTMINDSRLAIGKGTIGFVNPTVNFDITPRIDEKVLTIFPSPF